jgi:small-conductance mechanosensitive channel
MMLTSFLNQTFFHNQVKDYFMWLGILFSYLLAIRIAKAIVLNRVKAWAAKTTTTIDDFIIAQVEKVVVPLLYFSAFYVSTQSLTLDPGLRRGINVLGMVLITVFSARFLIEVVDYSIGVHWLKKEKNENRIRSLKGITIVARVVIGGLALVLLLDNLGVKISALIAGLGIGGVAVALASQAVLGDLFSFFVILFDRPFDIGDFIVVNDFMGSVEHIGVKTTRVRSLTGEQLVFSNTYLTNAQVRNYKRMDQRRITFNLGLTYDTTTAQLKEVPHLVETIIKGVKDTQFDRAHFISYGDFSLNFEIVYYVTTSDYNRYMDIQQEINLKIKEEFEQRKIEFAYPTQTVFISK